MLDITIARSYRSLWNNGEYPLCCLGKRPRGAELAGQLPPQRAARASEAQYGQLPRPDPDRAPLGQLLLRAGQPGRQVDLRMCVHYILYVHIMYPGRQTGAACLRSIHSLPQVLRSSPGIRIYFPRLKQASDFLFFVV